MDAENSDNKWITRKGAKKLTNRSFSVTNNNEKNKKISRNKSLNIIPSWERKHNRTITDLFKKPSPSNKSVKNVSKSELSRTEKNDNQSKQNSIIGEFSTSEETKIISKAKTEAVANEKSKNEQFKSSCKETKVIDKHIKGGSESTFCSFPNSSTYRRTFSNEKFNVTQNINSNLSEQINDCELIGLEKADINSDHKMCTLPNPLNFSHEINPLNVSNEIIRDRKNIQKKYFDLNEIFEVPKFTYKEKILEERLKCMMNCEDTDLALKNNTGNEIISLKNGNKHQIKDGLNDIFKCQNFKHNRLSVRERLSQFV